MTLLPIVDDMVNEVEAELKKLQDFFSSIADRSVSIGVVNNSGYTLNFVNCPCSSGGIDPKYDLPATSIPPNEADKFTVSSTGLARGAVGTVIYTATDSDGNDAEVRIQLIFDNPELGENTYDQRVDVTNSTPAATFRVLPIGSSGNNSKVRYTITAS
jgi:hypothetical protein